MKMLSLLGFFVLAVFSFTSCKKNDTAPFEGFYNVEPIKVTQLNKVIKATATRFITKPTLVICLSLI